MTLQEARDKLRRLIGNPTTTSVTDVRLSELINQARRDIMTTYRFHKARNYQTFQTVAGTHRYTIPSDLNTLLRVWNATDRTKIGKSTLTDLSGIDFSVGGKATEYFRGSSTVAGVTTDWIEMFPTPDGVATIHLYYKTEIADQTVDANQLDLPRPWHIGVVYFARWIYFDEEGSVDRAQYCWNMWTLWVNKQPNEVDEELFANQDSAVQLPSLAEFRRGNRVDFETGD